MRFGVPAAANTKKLPGLGDRYRLTDTSVLTNPSKRSWVIIRFTWKVCNVLVLNPKATPTPAPPPQAQNTRRWEFMHSSIAFVMHSMQYSDSNITVILPGDPIEPGGPGGPGGPSDPVARGPGGPRAPGIPGIPGSPAQTQKVTIQSVG